jgi:hypothetical protein
MNSHLPPGLPSNVREVLSTFVESARKAFDEDLVAVVLFGSAAEGRLRKLSDVNVLLVLTKFDTEKAGCLSEVLQRAHASIRLSAMFLLQEELEPAVEAFAVKFGDISRRHVILHGSNPLACLKVPRAAMVTRLKQVLLNLTLRMRETLVARGSREEQMAAAIAECAGPLRACAATLLEIQGSTIKSPKEALETLAATLLPEATARSLMKKITGARTGSSLPHGAARSVFCELTTLANRILEEAGKL